MPDKAEKRKKSAKAEKNGVPLVEKAYQQIKLMLLVRELVPEQKLRYQDIAKRIQVSQTPVIMALTRLENEGLVQSQANKGFYIPKLDLGELDELYEMRAVIEGFLVARTGETISDGQLGILRGLMKEHQSFRSESYTLKRLWCDAKLHLALASFSGHEVGQKFLRQLFDRLYLRYRPESLAAERMLEAEQDHELVFEALEQRDSREAAKRLKQHIERGREHMLNGLKKDEQTKNALMPWD